MSPSKPELAVGHREIDAQHEELYRAAAELHSRVQVGEQDRAAAALRVFWDTATRHFATEQSLMISTRYPDRAAHERAHQLFLADASEMMAHLERSGLDEAVVGWALRRMPEWLRFHIETNDAPLARHLMQWEAKRIVGAALGGPGPVGKGGES